MRLLAIISALLMFLHTSNAAAQPSGATIDPRWGLLGDLAEQDLVSYYSGRPSMPATVRWQVPNKVVIFTDWGPVQRSEHNFTLDPATGRISVEGFSRVSPTAEATASGEIFWIVGAAREPFLTRSSDGAVHARWTSNKLDYFPISRAPAMQAKLAKLIAAGKVPEASNVPRPASAAMSPPVQPERAHSESGDVDPRWGVLAEIAERDLVQLAALGSAPSTVRWEIPGQSLVWTTWGGMGTATFRFSWDEATHRIKSDMQGWGNFPLVAQPSGEVMQIIRDKSERFLWRAEDGTYRLRAFNGAVFKFAPIETRPALRAKVDKLVASGKVRAADPSLNTRMASAPPVVAPPQALAPQTVIATTIQEPQPAPSISPAIAAAAAVSGPRYALVIGNSQYQLSLGRLPNPVNDAQSVAAALRAVGFDVDLVLDADQKGMKRAISRFGERLSTARGATGLFYYAGHGIQSRGTNYLIPVSAPIEREADLDLEAVAADTVLAQMEDAGAATSIVILDACRNMPLARSFRSASRGLARMDAPNGSFIAYSTAPGATAADGDGRNSPFATALVRQLAQKGTPIEVVFRSVRKDVLEATGGQQVPWDSSSLVDPFYFVP